MANPITKIKKIISPERNNFLQLKLFEEKISQTKKELRNRLSSAPLEEIQNNKATKAEETKIYSGLRHLFSNLNKE